MTIHSQINVRCGDAWTFVGPLTDNNGNALNLAGATLTYKIDSLDFSTNIITLTVDQGISVSGNTATYGPTKEQTASIAPGTYYDTLRVDYPDGVSGYTVIEGIINAAPTPA